MHNFTLVILVQNQNQNPNSCPGKTGESNNRDSGDHSLININHWTSINSSEDEFIHVSINRGDSGYQASIDIKHWISISGGDNDSDPISFNDREQVLLDSHHQIQIDNHIDKWLLINHSTDEYN